MNNLNNNLANKKSVFKPMHEKIDEDNNSSFAKIQGYFCRKGSHLSLSAKWTYTILHLWNFNTAENGEIVVNPSVEHIVIMTGLSKNTVLAALDELVYFGWIQKIKKKELKSYRAKKYKSTQYIFTVPIGVKVVDGVRQVKTAIYSNDWNGKIIQSPASKKRGKDIKAELNESYHQRTKEFEEEIDAKPQIVDFKKIKTNLLLRLPKTEKPQENQYENPDYFLG